MKDLLHLVFLDASNVVGVSAVAVPMQILCPARHRSPKNSPGPSIATIASFPSSVTKDSFRPPLWMYMTWVKESPGAKMTVFLGSSTPFQATLAESRKA